VLNPFRSEQDAFKFLLYVGGACLLIVLAVLVVRAF
jgi:hypothetical protein